MAVVVLWASFWHVCWCMDLYSFNFMDHPWRLSVSVRNLVSPKPLDIEFTINIWHLYHTCPKMNKSTLLFVDILNTAGWVNYSSDPDQTKHFCSLLWIYTVCPGMSVRFLRVNTVYTHFRFQLVFYLHLYRTVIGARQNHRIVAGLNGLEITT